MGQSDIVLNTYMRRDDRIQSVLEYWMGEKLPEDWRYRTEDGLYPLRNSKGKISFRQRDIVKRIHTAGGTIFLGLENQTDYNLIFPWRVLEMDTLFYGREIEEIQEKNRTKKYAYGSEDDFMYYYGRSDRLSPILNLTLYWGKKEWKSPLCLRDMMNLNFLPDKLVQLVGDYKVHLISMRSIKEEDLEKMNSDLKYVLGILRHSDSRKEYVNYVFRNRDFFRRIPRSALDVIDVCTKIKNLRKYISYADNPEKGEEVADMCQALIDIEKHALDRGIKQGRKQGIEQGIKQGEISLLCTLVLDGILSVKDAAERSGLTESGFRKKLAKFNARKSRI